MTQKNTGRHAPDHSMAADKNTAGRRKLLKAALVGGGAITTAKHLPDQWSAPVIDSVLLPAHAETSGGSVTGVFTAGDINLDEQTSAPALNAGTQFALLDSLISPARAVPVGICEDAFAATIIFRINANNSVDVVILLSNSDVASTNCTATTQFHPGTGKIDDVTVAVNVSNDIQLTNLSANAAAVTGSWGVDGSCGDTFTAPLGGNYPADPGCMVL